MISNAWKEARRLHMQFVLPLGEFESKRVSNPRASIKEADMWGANVATIGGAMQFAIFSS